MVNFTVYIGDVVEALKQIPSERVNCIVTSPPYWCYAGGHEVLTKDGWKPIEQVKEGGYVLSVNPENMFLEWVKVVATKRWKYNGKMIQFKNTHVDLLVTPNHRMFVYNRHIGVGVKPRSKVGYFKYAKNMSGWHFVEAKDIKHGYVTPKTGFKWKGKEQQFFILPALEIVYNKQKIYLPPKKIKIEHWLSFFGLWIAEGSVRGSKGGKKKTYSISIKQKSPKDKKVRKLLKLLPFRVSESNSKNNIARFEITDIQLWHYLKQFGNSHTKYIPQEIKEFSSRLLRVLLGWYLFGDGCIRRKGTNHKELSCYSVSKRLKDDILEIALKTGQNISVRGQNTLVFLRRRTIKLAQTKSKVSYFGYIYGIEVERNHTLCIRRNNKVIFSGNSLRDYGEETCKIWGGNPNCEHEWESEYVRKRTLGDKPSKNSVVAKFRPDEVNRPEIVNTFCKKCGAWFGQLGLEPSLDLYLSHLWQVTDECYRVLRKDGVMWWNQGDCYGGGGGSGGNYAKEGLYDGEPKVGKNRDKGILPKSLALQNYRLLLGLVDIDYRILVEWRVLGKPEGSLEEMLNHPRIRMLVRNQVIWHKPSHLPSSAVDRLTGSYEPVFFLTKSKKYFFDLDIIREPHKASSLERNKYGRKSYDAKKTGYAFARGFKAGDICHPAGKNPGDLWSINLQPFSEAHFACFSSALVRKPLLATCPQWVCRKCGKPRERIVKIVQGIPSEEYKGNAIKDYSKANAQNPSETKRRVLLSMVSQRNTVGFTDCGCGAGFDAGTVLDPFVGSGTTLQEAMRQRKNGIGIELNPEYASMIMRRLNCRTRVGFNTFQNGQGDVLKFVTLDGSEVKYKKKQAFNRGGVKITDFLVTDKKESLGEVNSESV